MNAAVVQVPRRSISVGEYHAMIASGILDEDEHVELLEGDLALTTPQHPAHARTIQRLTRLLVSSLDERFAVLPQLPLTLDERNEPEPDLAVVPAREAASAESHPRSALLVVEVARESLRKDREVKAAVYARAGILECWIVNLADGCIETYEDPDRQAATYRVQVAWGRGKVLAASSLPDVSVDVSALLDD